MSAKNSARDRSGLSLGLVGDVISTYCLIGATQFADGPNTSPEYRSGRHVRTMGADTDSMVDLQYMGSASDSGACPEQRPGLRTRGAPLARTPTIATVEPAKILPVTLSETEPQRMVRVTRRAPKFATSPTTLPALRPARSAMT